MNLGIQKYSVSAKTMLLIVRSVSCCAGIVINLRLIIPIIFLLSNENKI